MAICKGCGREIRWIRMAGGKAMPCDPAPVYYEDRYGGETIVTEDGRVSRGSEAHVAVIGSKVRGYKSHFATCPVAEGFRRTGR